jgi:autophagy-related protein 17
MPSHSSSTRNPERLAPRKQAMNSSDSDSSSEVSPSPPTSPQQSSGFHGEPSLERLVLHFVAAKKSLTATQHVYRATELATSSRALIEEIAALNAKNSYARRGVDEQLETLREIRTAVADAGEHAGDEFKQTIASLDVANDRLQSTLGSLRKVIIDRSLQKHHKQTTTRANTSTQTQPTKRKEKKASKKPSTTSSTKPTTKTC